MAAAGEVELELGPAGWLHEGAKKFRVAPAVVANFGFAGRRELVVQGQREVALEPAAGEPRSSVVDDGVFIKQVLRPGALQEEPGPSVATEYGLLLPSVHGESGTGASVAGIVSERGPAGTIHLNSVLSYTREHEPDLFLGCILEAPYAWAVRPVAEIYAEQASGGARTESALAGAIWRARDALAFDVGVRRAHAGGETVRELRLGLTWAFPYAKEH